jgi:predicted chitinase
LARACGVDLARLAEAPVDPIQQVQQQARQEIERARQQERESILAQLQQQQQQQAAAYEQQLADFIGQFKADKPNWDEIESDLVYHVHALRATNPGLPPHEILKTAYDRALASRPEADPRAKESAQKELAERKRKANEAKRLASLNVKSMIGAAPKSVGKDMYAEMADIYDRVASR